MQDLVIGCEAGKEQVEEDSPSWNASAVMLLTGTVAQSSLEERQKEDRVFALRHAEDVKVNQSIYTKKIKM